jgi:hypothetical protein
MREYLGDLGAFGLPLFADALVAIAKFQKKSPHDVLFHLVSQML